MRRRRSILGPIVLITVGVLFAIDYIWGRWDFSQTWPVILVVVGIVKLFERVMGEDHGYYYSGPRPWGPETPTGTPAGTSAAYPGAPPPPPGTAQAVPPPPAAPIPGTTPEYPTYPSYPSSSSDSGDGHAS